MLQLTIMPPDAEQWDPKKKQFVYKKGITITLEHSLVSISKWESKWCKPFISKEPQTREESIDYIRCMTLTQNVDPKWYDCITDANIEEVNRYIEAPMTATWFKKEKNGLPSREQITSELIYYWMIALEIPFECQKWHLNRLLTLIRVCNVKNQKPRQMNQRELMNRNRALVEARRKQFNTRG